MKIVHLRPEGLAQHQRGLRRLEENIRYPIADGADHFRIDHGARYSAFFERMGEAHFLVALDGDEVIGTFAGVGKWAESGGRRVPTPYGGDCKIAPAWRGGRLAPRFFWKGLSMVWRPDVPRWHFCYGAAMRGARGDVMRSARRTSLMRLSRPAARLHVYFIPRATLLMMDPAGCPTVPPGGLDLSPDARHDPRGITSTAGEKDLILESTGKPWPLWHLPLGPRAWTPNFATYLESAAEALPEDATACFSIDERLTKLVEWLRAREIAPGATCTVYMFRLPGAPRPEPWVHLATSEI
jgi:hypothetical protein